MRLFMVPGMGHCVGGTGATAFNPVAAIEAWIERGQVPAQIPTARIEAGNVTRTRVLCAYPQVSEYLGGNPDRAESFVCRMP